MAAPHVAGVAALYLENNPTASPATVSSTIINTATTGVLSGIIFNSPNRLLYSLLTGPPPVYEGFVDHVSCDSITGWAADRNRLNTSINVKIYDGSTLATTVLARDLRTDVGNYLGDNGRHGFAIKLPTRFKDGQQHILRVRFEDSTTANLTNSPQTMTCGSQYTYYEVVARHSGKCLDVFDASTMAGANVIQWPCIGDFNQQWLIIPIGDGYYKFIARHSNKVLSIPGGNANGAPAVQSTEAGTAPQQWRIVDVDSGYIRLISRPSGKSLEVNGGSSVDGTQVQQWDYFGAAHQQWLLRQRN